MNIVSFGGGTNSAALLIGLYKHKIPIDLITFADTGAEHPHTYQFIEIINQWLAEHGVEIFFTQVFRDSFFHADSAIAPHRMRA